MQNLRKIPMISLLAAGLLYGLMSNAMAGCKINISAQNNSNGWSLMNQLVMKSKGGTWSSVFPVSRKNNSFKINAGKKFEQVSNATFGCKAKRRYRFSVRNQARGVDCVKSIYYPSATGWTTQTNINFGDISRHCK